MLKLNAIKSEKIWGYELWIASTHPNGCQKDFEAFAGGDYPLLVKVIQADDVLSVQRAVVEKPNAGTYLTQKKIPDSFTE